MQSVSAQSGGKEYLDDFYLIYSRNMRDLGSPSHSKDFFAQILCCFPDSANIHITTYNGQPVASGLTLKNNSSLEIPWASSLREHNHLCVNHLLYWHILKNASKQKIKSFHFGRSTVGSGTFHFKKQWGAQSQPLYWYDIGKGKPLNTSDLQASHTFAIKLWKKLPVSMARHLGPHFIRNLP